jgi:hypothetical protein
MPPINSQNININLEGSRELTLSGNYINEDIAIAVYVLYRAYNLALPQKGLASWSVQGQQG